MALPAEDLRSDCDEMAEARLGEFEKPVQRAIVGQLQHEAAAQEEAVGRLEVAVEHLHSQKLFSMCEIDFPC